MKNFKLGQIANWGGLVKELGFLFVTQFMSLEPSKVITQNGEESLMSAELAHQEADKHLCVATHRKVRIRLHPSDELDYRIGQAFPSNSKTLYGWQMRS